MAVVYRRRGDVYPEMIRPGTWTIRHQERGGYTNLPKRVLSAPLDESAFARGLRLHELAHVRFSPIQPNPQLWRADLATVLAVEDARVNDLVGRAGLGHVMDPLDDPASAHPDPRDNLRAATLLLVAAHGTGAFARLWSAYGASGDAGATARAVAARAIAMLQAPGRRTFRRTVATARFLDRALGTTEHVPTTTLCRVHVHAADASEDDVDLDDLLRRRMRRPARPAATAPPEWGRLREVEEPPLPIRMRATPPWKTHATSEGSLVRAAYRFRLDGRVFARRRRLPGASVLIDGSGSMSLDRAALMAIVDAAPAALVARYDGDAAANVGAIRVLARDGRRVDDPLLERPCCGKGNVIDGPALRWLATRPRPRIWVSDGHVTGVGDRAHDELTAESRAICDAHGIVRVENAEAARKAL